MKSEDIHLYQSIRGIPLVYYGPPKDKPVLTIENYLKWYSLYLVMPDGSVEAVEYSEFPDLISWGDHCVNPNYWARLVKKEGWYEDENAFDMVVGRWVIEIEDALFGLLTQVYFRTINHMGKIKQQSFGRDLTEAESVRVKSLQSLRLDLEVLFEKEKGCTTTSTSSSD